MKKAALCLILLLVLLGTYSGWKTRLFSAELATWQASINQLAPTQLVLATPKNQITLEIDPESIQTLLEEGENFIYQHAWFSCKATFRGLSGSKTYWWFIDGANRKVIFQPAPSVGSTLLQPNLVHPNEVRWFGGTDRYLFKQFIQQGNQIKPFAKNCMIR